MTRAAAALALILLPGCAAVGEGPQASSVTVPTTFLYEAPPGERGTLDDLLPNGDPAFRTLVAAVDSDAPDLQAALARVDAARAGLRAAGAARAPNITANSNASYSRISENAVVNVPAGTAIDPTNASFSAGIDASWDLDLFGRLRASQRAATLRLDAADADARAVRLALVADIARAVTDYRMAEARLFLADADFSDAAALARLTDTRIRAGISPGLDLVRAQSLEAAARAQQGPARAARAEALGRLVTLTARDGTAVAAAFTQPATPGVSSLPPVGLPSLLLRQRPDVVAAERRLSAANAEIAAAAAARFPNININGVLGLAALALGDLFSTQSLNASVGGGITAPLLDFGRIEAQIDARQADAKEAFALYRKTVFGAIGEAETALGSLQASQDRLAALEAQLAVEQDAVALATQRYRMGLSNFLGVIDAQRQLNIVRQSLIASHGETEQARVAVYRAFGG